MNVLLDTCVVSELSRDRRDSRLREQLEAIADDGLFLSVITLGELSKGVALVDAQSKRRRLSSWLSKLELDYRDRVLPVDAQIARIWGDLTARAQQRGRIVPVCDGLIAATAIRHGLYVMTHNVKDFETTGAMILEATG